MRAFGKLPSFRRIRALSSVSRFRQFTTESCLNPERCPSTVVISINNWVGSKDLRVTLVIWATMVFSRRWLSRSFWITRTGRTLVPPVLVIQNDRDNQRLLNTIVAQITSVTRRSLEPTQLLIEITTVEGQRSGLRQDSVVNCLNLLTLDKARILRKLG